MIRHLTVWQLLLPLALFCLLAAGCSASPYDPLPDIDREISQRSVPEDPRNGTVLTWRGSRKDLYTFWGRQEVTTRVLAYLPKDWKEPGDGIWRARVRNQESKPLPFLGLLRRSGKESRIVPPVDLKRLPDGLYSLILPGVELGNGEIASVMPRLFLCEIREGRFQPFRIGIPLHPLEESPLTGPPPQQPKEEAPQGTRYPFSIPDSDEGE